MIRVAFIGQQGHAGIGLGSVSETDDAEVGGFAPVQPEEMLGALEQWRQELGEVPAYQNYQELIEKQKPDLVQVSGAFYRNGVVAEYAAAHGCNVLVEKPVSTTLDLLEKLKEVVVRGGVRLTAMLTARFEPTFITAKKAVASGAIGEPLLVSAQKSYRFGKSRPAYFRQRKTYGGTIPWVGIHAIDWLHWLLDDPFARVTALHGNFNLEDYPGCEDAAAMLFELRNGGAALVSADYLRPSGASSHGDDRLRIAGSAGVLELMNGRVSLIDAGGERELPLEQPKDNVFTSFVRCLARGTEHPSGRMDAFRVTEVALKARDAADTGQPVSLLDSAYSVS